MISDDLFAILEHEKHKIFTKKHSCLYPGCECKKSDIISSHTIQKSGSISLIAEKGHVLKYIANEKTMTEFDNFGYTDPVRVGIQKASIYPGFCRYHDNSLFYEIDREELGPSDKQLLLYSFRSLAYELAMKNAAYESTELTDNFVDAHMNLTTKYRREGERIQDLNFLSKIGYLLGLRDLQHDYDVLSEMIHKDFFSGLDYLLFRINRIPQVQCTLYYNPSFDLDGNHIQDMSDNESKTENFSLSVFANRKTGYALIAWQKKSDIMRSFVSSLLNQKDIANTLVGAIFSYSENHVFSQNWWEELSILKKRDLCKRFFTTSDAAYDLKENIYPVKIATHMKFVDWSLEAKTNNFEIAVQLDLINFPLF